MKNIILGFFTVFILTMVLNCSATKVNNQHYQREWMMVSFDQFTKQQLMENGAEINLTGEKSGNQIKGTATMGCNKIFFLAELKNNGKIKFSEIGSTEMACKNMELENAFMKKFGSMKNYLIEGHRLTLSDDKGSEMKFIAADWD
ncbi:META domain-containing protein [Chryseobacterium wangxinyae]|uniref:META domain-containing protein n=1 Tax=Chryseobacterium sp. CY350 TaxID=2997336 RepID=UPI00226F4D30|nr:META domain-containing protein [Chryseobacterium sp. CY350]MCY0976005.1 META domain-containing protein [Chryseobacterium sp. CY350]WBZ94393.1 META domain-containing protein [Chryseobacterium sp. CY350]